MLEVEALNVAAGSFRLRDVNLAVGRGECHVVLGPSGSGKSTLLHALLGVLPSESGRIRLDGADLTRVPIERRGLGYVPQQLGLFPHLTVRENLAYSARARRVPSADYQPLVDKLVAATGIGALLERRPATLSGGERQRVGLVRALASRPRMVLLDEPFTALNESLRRELWQVFRELQRDRELTILMITHDLAEACFLANRVTVLLDGRLAQQGETAVVFRHPVSPEVARFLSVETLQPGRVVAVEGDLATIEVGTARLVAAASPGLRDGVMVSIRGEEVVLGGNSGSTANILSARVVAVHPGIPLVRVELDAGFPLVATLTRPAWEEIALQPGDPVTTCIKPSGIHLMRPG